MVAVHNDKNIKSAADEEKLIRNELQMQLELGGDTFKKEQHFRRNGLINPEGEFLEKWGIVIMIALVFTAVVTPFEVAFVNTTIDNPLFWFNRVIDLVFVVDTICMFFIPYMTPAGTWELDRRLIAKKYLSFWFWIDFISLIPFDVIGVVSNNQELQDAKGIRLIRLLKLARLLRSSRVLNRLEQNLPIKFAYYTFIKFCVVVLMVDHWFACLLGLVPVIEETDKTFCWWIAYFEVSLGQPAG